MKKIICLIGFALLFLVGCKTISSSQEDAKKNLPQSYVAGNDTSNSAMINWKKYFPDTNLVSLIEEAVANNQDYLIALQRIEVARSSVRFAKGARLPSVHANIGAGQRKFGLYTMDGAGNSTTEITPGKIVPIDLQDYSLGLQTSWEVDVWGKLRNRKRAAVSRYLASIEGRNLVLTNLISELALSYYELLALDSEAEIISETIQLQSNALEIVKVQKEAGAANELAVKQFEGQLMDSKAMEKDIGQQILQCENRINLLTGRFPRAIKRDKSKFLKTFDMTVKRGVPSDLLQNRPDIREAEHALMAARADVRAARLAFYPSLNITGGVGFQAFNTEYLFLTPASVTYNLLGGITAPLINRSAIKAEYRSANAMQLEAYYNYQKAIVNGYREVYNEVARIQALEEMYAFKEKQSEASLSAIEISSELFRTGRVNYLEVLMVQRSSLEARLELVSTRQQQYDAIVNLYKALGGGWR